MLTKQLYPTHPPRSAHINTSKPVFEHISPPAPTKPVDRRNFIKGSLAAGFAAAVLPVTAQTIYTDSIDLTVGEVKVPTKDGSIPAYFAMPATGKNLGMVLVVHEIFGVHEHIKDICRRLAKAGYYAIAPASSYVKAMCLSSPTFKTFKKRHQQSP